MREKFQRFMYGRYGVDDLSRFMLYVTLGLCLINMFIHSQLIGFLVLVGLFVLYFRMFSKNHSKRYEENRKFLTYKSRFLTFFARKKDITAQKKDFRIYSCPDCRQKIRIPKGKGKIEVTCPKCGTKFIKRS